MQIYLPFHRFNSIKILATKRCDRNIYTTTTQKRWRKEPKPTNSPLSSESNWYLQFNKLMHNLNEAMIRSIIKQIIQKLNSKHWTKSIDNKFFLSSFFTNYNKSLVCKQLKYRHLRWSIRYTFINAKQSIHTRHGV